MFSTKFIQLIGIFIIALITLNSCNGKLPGGDARKNPADPKKRIEQNIKDGKSFRLFDGSLGNSKGGTFDFASSNELWRATVEILDFVPLTNASYSGGIIITEWFSSENTNRELKITIQFMTNEIRADAIKVLVFEKICAENNNCKTKKVRSKLEGELKLAILKKAALFERDDFKKYKETEGKNKGKSVIKKQ